MLCLQFHEDKNGTLSCNKTTIEHSLVQGLGKTCWFANNLLRFISYTKKWVRAAYWNIVNVASEIYTPPPKKKEILSELSGSLSAINIIHVWISLNSDCSTIAYPCGKASALRMAKGKEDSKVVNIYSMKQTVLCLAS